MSHGLRVQVRVCTVTRGVVEVEACVYGGWSRDCRRSGFCGVAHKRTSCYFRREFNEYSMPMSFNVQNRILVGLVGYLEHNISLSEIG